MQHICILTGGSDIHTPITDLLKSKVPYSEILVVRSDNSEDILDKVKSESPFFGEYYYVDVICETFDNRSLTRFLRDISKIDNSRFIFYTDTRKKFDVITGAVDNLFIMNNYNPDEKIVKVYLNSYLNKHITADAERKLYRLMRGQWNLLPYYVTQLEQLDKKIIRISDIEAMIPKVDRLYFNDLLVSIITLDKLDRNVKKLFSYKYANRYVMRRLKEEIDLLIKLKLSYVKGEFNLDNLHEYCDENKVSAYKVEDYFHRVLRVYSTEYIYYIKFLIDRYKDKNDGILQIIMTVSRQKGGK